MKTAQLVETGKSYELKIICGKFSVYKIVTPKDGNLNLTLETFTEYVKFALFNGDGASFNPTKSDYISGDGWGGLQGCNRVDFAYNDKVELCRWNSTVEKFKGTFSFKLDEGTYYLFIFRGETGLSAANLTLQFKDLSGREIK